ncbi:MAG: CDP-glycerol glycerophosphotransferase family protein, partial [Aeromicrobium sp.]
MNQAASRKTSRVSLAHQELAQRKHLVFAVLLVVLAVITLSLGRHWPIGALLVLLAVIAGVRHLFGDTPPYAYGLPGLADGPPPPSRVPSSAYAIVSAVVTAAAIVLLALDAPVTAFVVLAAVAVIAWLIAAESAFRLIRQTRRLRRALVAYRPEIGMAYAGRSGGPWQLMMWEPHLLRSGLRNIIINRNETHRQMILDGSDLKSPFIQLGSNDKRDAAALMVPSLKALYYVQNARNNSIFMRHKGVTHVWLNHGDSDKPANFNPRHADYDKLVVCGQAGIDRYERHGIHVDADKFEIVGRPQAREIKMAAEPIAEVEQPVVLYAPTWQGVDPSVNFSSLDQGAEIIRQLTARGATVIFRPHPLSKRWKKRRIQIKDIIDVLKADHAESGRTHVYGPRANDEWSVADCTNHCDALISDVSSVVSDFLQSEKPYA